MNRPDPSCLRDRSGSPTGIRVYFLGRGANVLVDDNGIDGLVICTRRSLQRLQLDGDLIVAEAGVPLPSVAHIAAKLGLSGFEFLVGIPGTVGGGVVMNAGVASAEIEEIRDVLFDVDIVDHSGNLLTLKKHALSFGYRTSSLLDQGLFVIRARFQAGATASPDEVRANMAALLAERRRTQPRTKWTAGSTFKNPANGKPAGRYIDSIGLKGHSVGGAMVSRKHANWIENTGDASAEDIRHLIDEVRERVAAAYGVWLEREVRYLPQDQMAHS